MKIPEISLTSVWVALVFPVVFPSALESQDGKSLAANTMVQTATDAGPAETTALEWPRERSYQDGSKLVIYQPQIMSWPEYSHVAARAAIAFSTAEAESPSLGTFEFEADSEVDMRERLVRLSGFEIGAVQFPGLDDLTARRLVERLQSELPNDALIVALDRMVANLERSQVALREVTMKSDPPVIFVNTKPSVLVLFDGRPILHPVDKTGLKFAINTNWDVFSTKRNPPTFSSIRIIGYRPVIWARGGHR